MDGKLFHLLGREPLDIHLPDLTGERILVTGAEGFIGSLLCKDAVKLGAQILRSDIEQLNVLDMDSLTGFRMADFHPTAFIHLAAHKYATTAELHPASVTDLNVRGTKNIRSVAKLYKARMVLASTCKAADPCTVYGASKLIAERTALTYDQAVAFRLVNVLGSTGSVLDIWQHTPFYEPIKVMSGLRYWISPGEAVRYLLQCIHLPHGLYAPNTQLLGLEGSSRIAKRFNHRGGTLGTPLRRGDRFEERLLGEYESVEACMDSIMKIRQPWD